MADKTVSKEGAHNSYSFTTCCTGFNAQYWPLECINTFQINFIPWLTMGCVLCVALHSDDGAFGSEVFRGSYAHPFN